ncbi:MAG: RecQ family ATP-dependent DNA helicase [Flavobacteriaceae bacterium]|nr:RecQ family ATP-dependent DNA helicase [Flavobacteriaceae bacterium]
MEIDSKQQTSTTWTDRLKRNAWSSEYHEVGSCPSFIQDFIKKSNSKTQKLISQSYFLFKSPHIKPRNKLKDNDLLSSILMKILQRGQVPNSTLEVEKNLIKKNNLTSYVSENIDNTDLTYKVKTKYKELINEKSIEYKFTQKDKLKIDEEFDHYKKQNSLFDDESEIKFLKIWISENLGNEAQNWFIPQASLDRILESYQDVRPSEASRRIDFLFLHPNCKTPLAIEIDGKQHNDNTKIDKERDDSLAQCGIQVIRVSTDELNKGTGPNLEIIKRYCKDVLESNLNKGQETFAQLIHESSFCSKVQFAIAKAIKYGWLENKKTWKIEIRGLDSIVESSVIDILNMLVALNNIYKTSLIPKATIIKSDNNEIYLDEKLSIQSDFEDTHDNQSVLIIDVQKNKSPVHEVTGESDTNSSDIIIRSAFLPIPILLENFTSSRVGKECTNENISEKDLTTLLNHIFRKTKFREGQFISISNILRQKDTVVLLPTGAGKSLIYQLAGLIMPGITIIIDPITALIEDQVDGLYKYGIDRAVGISSNLRPDKQKNLLEELKKSQKSFIFITPERLQSPKFRQNLNQLTQTTIINAVAIDEAHCVSEWGHDFRPAYLNLSRNIRVYMKDNQGLFPPIAALTGTASRSVLKDVLVELSIKDHDTESIIRPLNFDREELKFFIHSSREVGHYKHTVEGAINSLPDRFNLTKEELFQPKNENTHSGIIFVPHKSGTYGVSESCKIIKGATDSNATVYAGGVPKGFDYRTWKQTRRENAEKFKSNDIPILVATKAFGMGIDKSNIRYTLHLGIPSSLENFYQEAGRAGRDKKESFCGIVFTEFSSQRTDALLNSSLSHDKLKAEYEKANKSRATEDDIIRQLHFHFLTFKGKNVELNEVKNIIDAIDDFTIPTIKSVSFTSEKERGEHEKAIFRLVRTGVFRDYTIDFGSKKFDITIDGFDLDICKDKLQEYVKYSQPGMVKVFKDRLDTIIPSDGDKNNILRLAKALIDFTYKVVESSRRRSLLEVVRVARNSKNDQAIRTSINNYLTEGVSSQELIKIIESRDDITSVINNIREFLEKVELQDAPEIKGASTRLLESYPDNPGLLLVRIITEGMVNENVDNLLSQDLSQLIQASQKDFGLSTQDVYNIFEWLVNYANAKVEHIVTLVVVSIYKSIDSELLDRHGLRAFEKELINISNPDIDKIKAVYNMKETMKSLEYTTHKIHQTFTDSEIRGILK